MNLRIFESVEELTRGCARAIVQKARQAQPFRIALSGGTTPGPIYEMLGSDPLRQELEDLEIHWIVGDERYVPIDDPASNAGMIQRTLFHKGMSQRHRFLPFRTEESDPARTVELFAEEWHSLGIERLDLALQGMGEDGHTASLFPGTSALDVLDGVACEVYVPRLQSWRVTLTLPILQASRTVFVLAAGESKREVLEAIREGNKEFPVTKVVDAVEDSWWFVDRNAVPDPSS